MAGDGVAVVGGVAGEGPAPADGVTDEAGIAQRDADAVDPAGVDKAIGEIRRGASDELLEANLIRTVFGADGLYEVGARRRPTRTPPRRWWGRRR